MEMDMGGTTDGTMVVTVALVTVVGASSAVRKAICHVNAPNYRLTDKGEIFNKEVCALSATRKATCPGNVRRLVLLPKEMPASNVAKKDICRENASILMQLVALVTVKGNRLQQLLETGPVQVSAPVQVPGLASSVAEKVICRDSVQTSQGRMEFSNSRDNCQPLHRLEESVSSANSLDICRRIARTNKEVEEGE